MFDLQVVVLMCCAIVFSGDHASVHAKTPKETGLYSNEDDVIILNKNDFKNLVYNKEEAWVIEFYSTWCGHCKRIAPTWKKFASDLKGNLLFRPLLSRRVCVTDVHRKLCDKRG